MDDVGWLCWVLAPFPTGFELVQAANEIDTAETKRKLKKRMLLLLNPDLRDVLRDRGAINFMIENSSKIKLKAIFYRLSIHFAA